MEERKVKVITEIEIKRLLSKHEKLLSDIDFIISKADFYGFDNNFIKNLSDKRIKEALINNIKSLNDGVFKDGDYENICSQHENIEKYIVKFVGSVDEIIRKEELKRKNNSNRMVNIKITSFDNKRLISTKDYLYMFNGLKFRLRVEKDEDFTLYQRTANSEIDNSCIKEAMTFFEYSYDKRYTKDEDAIKIVCSFLKIRSFKNIYVSSNKEYIEDMFYLTIQDNIHKTNSVNLFAINDEQYQRFKSVHFRDKRNVDNFNGRYGFNKYSRVFEVNKHVRSPFERLKDKMNYKNEIQSLNEPIRNTKEKI